MGAFYGTDYPPNLITANMTSHTFSILVGPGDGTFPDHSESPAGMFPYSVVAADFNRDGNLDLAIAASDSMGNTTSTSILVYNGNGDASFSDPIEFQVGSEPHFVVTGDFNGDGQPDLAVANSATGTVSVLINNTY